MSMALAHSGHCSGSARPASRHIRTCRRRICPKVGFRQSDGRSARGSPLRLRGRARIPEAPPVMEGWLGSGAGASWKVNAKCPRWVGETPRDAYGTRAALRSQTPEWRPTRWSVKSREERLRCRAGGAYWAALTLYWLRRLFSRRSLACSLARRLLLLASAAVTKSDNDPSLPSGGAASIEMFLAEDATVDVTRSKDFLGLDRSRRFRILGNVTSSVLLTVRDRREEFSCRVGDMFLSPTLLLLRPAYRLALIPTKEAPRHAYSLRVLASSVGSLVADGRTERQAFLRASAATNRMGRYPGTGYGKGKSCRYVTRYENFEATAILAYNVFLTGDSSSSGLGPSLDQS